LASQENFPTFSFVPSASCPLPWPHPSQAFKIHGFVLTWALTPLGFHHWGLDHNSLATPRTAPPLAWPPMGCAPSGEDVPNSCLLISYSW
jgi:hypothetical protein